MTRCIGLEIFILGWRACLGQDYALAPVINSYAIECRVISLSRKDTIETQRQVAKENARCREAKRIDQDLRTSGP